MEKLKHCPFCGSKPMMQHIAYPNTEFWFVKCVNCSAEINNPNNTEKEAQEAWNKRTIVTKYDKYTFGGKHEKS